LNKIKEGDLFFNEYPDGRMTPPEAAHGIEEDKGIFCLGNDWYSCYSLEAPHVPISRSNYRPKSETRGLVDFGAVAVPVNAENIKRWLAMRLKNLAVIVEGRQDGEVSFENLQEVMAHAEICAGLLGDGIFAEDDE